MVGRHPPHHICGLHFLKRLFILFRWMVDCGNDPVWHKMSLPLSNLARNGSHMSVSSASSADSSSHLHYFTYSHHIQDFRSWLDASWRHSDARHERIALGHVKQGIAVTTREMMEMQVQHAPNLRGMLDCLPTRQPLHMEVGWRPKLGTWPLSKHEALSAKNWSV